MARSLTFYRDQVGLAVVSESETFVFLDGGSIRIALNAIADAVPDETSTEIVLEVDDVMATYEAMVKRGVPLEVAPREVMSGPAGSLLAAHFRDPDGHVMSITGWVNDGGNN